MNQCGQSGVAGMSRKFPEWVPVGALHYIAHTENGEPIRVLARAAGCHASTVLRQIRKVELRRDDPLVDAALRKLGAAVLRLNRHAPLSGNKEAADMNPFSEQAMPDDATLARESMRVLRRLCESGAVLAVAADLDKAVVVRDGPQGSTRTAVVANSVAQAMALKDWITPANTGRIIRYHITTAGRNALGAFLQRFGMAPSSSSGFAEAATSFQGQGAGGAVLDREEDSRPPRAPIGESPLSALARRRNNEGKPFLAEPLVHAGERLREDFELAQMDGSTAQNWDQFLTAGVQTGNSASGSAGGAAAEARARVTAALADLGPGLSDVALRCCCYLEGLEAAEKRLGWSARSGKVVLRIALMRLKRHYDETVGPGGPMIG
ncbi:helix-turn-helix domain containing protein [Sulfitobacter pacificus]|uniref:Helix-turn-helix domain containing protein n=2 Tax=Sulfitobacter pacificus TaxID=1499314 RepID=A0ABQ5VHG6_9RHOB|nr:helix-turn-helix domain containing protein [Sulfitobacter pacificus]